MVLNLVRKEGVRALAYAVNDVSVLSACSLKILYSDAQFALSLGYSITIPGVDGEQLLTLRYEGDNLVPGQTSLGNVDIPLPDESLHAIARHGQPRPRTLTLTLKAPCSLWYPRSLGNRVPSLQSGSHNLLTLARATQICIVFDTKWLGDNLALLQRIVEGSRQLAGVPVIPQFASVYQQADWSILNLDKDVKSGACPPTEDLASEAVPSIECAVAGPPPIEEAVYDAPPPYAHVSSKRSRHARKSLTPDSPPPKRLLQDPKCVPSPSRRVTSPSSVSPKSTASSTATVQVDVFQDTVTSAVEKVLPDLLRTQLPSILQDLLPRMLASPSPSPCLSPTPRSRHVANALTGQPSHKNTPAAVVRAVVSTYTETHLQKILNNALDEASQQASELYNSVGVELEDYIVDSKLELAALKEDHIAAFNDDCNEKLVEFKEQLVEEKDETEVEIKAHADEVVLKTWDRVNMVENACCRCKCPHGTKDRRSQMERGRRAMSAPVKEH